MTSKHDQNRAFALRSAIDTIEVTHLSREASCRKGMVLRMPDGQRMFWETRRPTVDERDEAKKSLRPYMECGGSSYCPCCRTHFRIPSVYDSIQEHGVCHYCLPFAEGEEDGVLVKRAPTLEEALAVPPNDIRQSEVWAMRDALIQRKEP